MKWCIGVLLVILTPFLSATPPASHLAGTYSIFSPEYRFLSPAVSSLLLQTNILRTSLLYEKDSPRVTLLKEIYHSPDGVEFGISHAPNSPVKDLQMATLGKLLSVLLTEEEATQKEKLSALILQDLNQTPYWQAREPARVRSSANTFANKILAAVSAPVDEAGMEEMLVYQAFVTAAWMKAETKSDLIPFFQALPVEVFHKKKAKNWPAWGDMLFMPKNYQKWSDRLKSRSFRKSDVPTFLQENLDLLAFGNEYHRNMIQTVPELIESRTVQLEIEAATHVFGDCGEASSDNWFRIVARNKDRVHLPYLEGIESTHNTGISSELLAYYKEYPTLENADSKEAREKYARLIASTRAVGAIMRLPKEAPVCELKPGFSNMLKTFEHLVFSKEPTFSALPPKKKLDRLCEVFSREKYALDWSSSANLDTETEEDVEVTFSINNEPAFLWSFTDSHFVITPVSAEKALLGQWALNRIVALMETSFSWEDALILSVILDKKNEPDLLKSIKNPELQAYLSLASPLGTSMHRSEFLRDKWKDPLIQSRLDESKMMASIEKGSMGPRAVLAEAVLAFHVEKGAAVVDRFLEELRSKPAVVIEAQKAIAKFGLEKLFIKLRDTHHPWIEPMDLEEGSQLLQAAAYFNHIGVVKLALAEGYDPKKKMKMEGGEISLLPLLAVIDKNVDLDLLRLFSTPEALEESMHGFTPLGLAALKGKANMVHMLLQLGANPNSSLPPPIFLAKTKKIFQLLVRHPKLDLEKEFSGEDFIGPVLIFAAANCDLYKVKALLQQGANPKHPFRLRGYWVPTTYIKEAVSQIPTCGKELKALFSETRPLKKAQPKVRE